MAIDKSKLRDHIPRKPFPKLPSETKRERSIKQENRYANKLGGVRRLASGALAGFKGDVKTPDYLVENKTTQNKSFSIKEDILKKHVDEAIGESKIPIMGISLENMEDGYPKDWVLLPLSAFQTLVEKDKK